jgi:hypothetical protein
MDVLDAPSASARVVEGAWREGREICFHMTDTADNFFLFFILFLGCVCVCVCTCVVSLWGGGIIFLRVG